MLAKRRSQSKVAIGGVVAEGLALLVADPAEVTDEAARETLLGQRASRGHSPPLARASARRCVEEPRRIARARALRRRAVVFCRQRKKQKRATGFPRA